MSDSTTSTLEYMQDTSYLNGFQCGDEVDGGELLDGLTDYFTRFEIPVGMVKKLFDLRVYRLVFIVDDSGITSSRHACMHVSTIFTLLFFGWC
jgi:hypothetical protein